MSLLSIVPISVLTDSYKAGHYSQYPDATKMVAYGEFRNSYEKDPQDTRFVFAGMRYLLENYLRHQWTEEDVNRADQFYSTHNAGFTPYPYPKDLFLKFVKENNGYFPVKIEALPEGTVANAHVPVYQITAEGAYSKLITFLETMLTQVWYPSTVATLSRRVRTLVQHAFDKSVEPANYWMIDYKLHDFGFRGCTSLEQSIIGGCAHLLNFRGTDTMSAAYYAQFHLNSGKPVATSIPATEHSVMTSWPSESAAILNMINTYGGPNNVFACVMDSYDYTNALDNILPAIYKAKVEKGGIMVLRPDSGDPVEVILQALRAADKVAGHVVNSKGFKVIHGFSVIQGDGIGHKEISAILDAVLAEGYSAENVTFGMGAGLLQKLNRDTMSFATKLSFMRTPEGESRKIMKKPVTSSGKKSFPGILKVLRDSSGNLNIYPREEGEVDPNDLLKVIWNSGPVPDLQLEDFEAIRDRVEREWAAVSPTHNPITPELESEITKWITDFEASWEKRSH